MLYREQDGERIPIGTAGPGAILSELALIADTKRLTSASAASDSEVIRLSRKHVPAHPGGISRRGGPAARATSPQELQAFLQKIERLGPRFAG